MKNKKVFLSYSWADKDFVINQIIPILNELNLNIPSFNDLHINIGESWHDSILSYINSADIFVVYINGANTNVGFEIGTAMGNSKPIVPIINSEYKIPFNIASFNYVIYDGKAIDDFKRNFKRTLLIVQENVIDKMNFSINRLESQDMISPKVSRKLIGIKLGEQFHNIEEELLITAELIKLTKDIIGTKDVELIQTSRGSFKSLFSINLEDWAKLLEKLIFFIPELKKKNAERVKIEAETQKILIETNAIKVETNIKQYQAFLDIIERSKIIGLKLQIDEDLIFINTSDMLMIKKPEKS